MLTSKTLYIFWKFIGLCPFSLTNGQTIKISYVGAIYSIVLMLSYAVCYTKAMANRMSYTKPHQTAMSVIGDIAAKSSQFLMIITTWSCFAFRQKKLQKIQINYIKIVEACKCLYLHQSYSKIIKNVKIQAAILNMSFVVIYTCGHLTQTNSNAFSAVFWTPFKIGRIVYPNFTILFVATMRVIRNQFQSLNDKMREFSKGISTSISIQETRRRANSKIRAEAVGLLATSDPLSAYILIHSKLIDLASSIINLWSPSLYLTMVIHLVQLAANFYDICLNVKYQKTSPFEENGYFVSLNAWFALHVGGMFLMIYAAESTTDEGKRTANILHEILITNPKDSQTESAKILSFRMLERPLTITLFGALPMKYSVLHKIVSLISGYVIIMMQLDELEQQRQRLHNPPPHPTIN